MTLKLTLNAAADTGAALAIFMEDGIYTQRNPPSS